MNFTAVKFVLFQNYVVEKYSFVETMHGNWKENFVYNVVMTT